MTDGCETTSVVFDLVSGAELDFRNLLRRDLSSCRLSGAFGGFSGSGSSRDSADSKDASDGVLRTDLG